MSLSKQMCAKPVSREVWRLDDVAAQWDKLVLRSYAIGSERRLYQGERRLYQSYPAANRAVPALRRRRPAAGTAMLCGTLAVHGTIASSDLFEIELEDPVLGRKITHSYRIRTLPDQG